MTYSRFAALAIFLLVLGAILLGYAILDSSTTRAEFARTCPSGTFFPAAQCEDLAARLQWDGTLLVTSLVLLAFGFVALGLSMAPRRQGIPDIPVHLFGPRSK